jgi:hypothetical protein
MDFWLIMCLGTLVALWAVSASRASVNVQEVSEYPDEDSAIPPSVPGLNPPHLPDNDSRIPPRLPEVWQYQPMDQVEFSDALELHYRDPLRNPLPSDPPRLPRKDFQD